MLSEGLSVSAGVDGYPVVDSSDDLGPVQLRISKLNGTEVVVESLLTETVGNFRKAVMAKLGLDAATHRVSLLIEGHILDQVPRLELREAGVKPELSITAIVRALFVESFEDLDLQEGLLQGIYSHGFEKPKAFQKRAIPPVMVGHDTILFRGRPLQSNMWQVQPSTFIIGALQRIDFGRKACQVLILVPSPEVAHQARDLVLALGKYLKAKCHVIDDSNDHDTDRIREGPHVVVGTPSRVYDVISKRHLRIEDLLCFALHETDEMLNGFKDQIYNIFKMLPPNVQVCLSSANLTPEIHDMTNKLMRDPVRIVDHPYCWAMETDSDSE